MVRVYDLVPMPRLCLVFLMAAGLLSGCGVVPRSRMEESQKVSQLLRAENARLKDQVLSLQSQNRDLADRAVDDLLRLTSREQAIERLERSVQAYQEDRERLAAAYELLSVSLGQPPGPARPGVGRPRPGRFAPDRFSEPSPSEPPPPQGVTSVSHADSSR
ncbi:MAG: hypothetical protein ACLQGP_24575 [Isosphaeraceae bacterium]